MKKSTSKKESPLRVIISIILYAFSFLLISLLLFPNKAEKQDHLYQISTINALLGGAYDGEISFKDLKKHGDFGHGTFDKLDGELIILDGESYQVKYDGTVLKVKDTMTSPYANTVFFKEDLKANLNSLISLKDLKISISSLIESKNNPYAVKISGLFKTIKLRSVPAQNKPYQDLASIIKEQNIFKLENIEGTMVGFWLPGYFKNINVPGYHFHFISKDRKFGGHVLDAGSMQDLVIELDKKTGFRLDLTESSDFKNADLSKDRTNELNKVENNG